MSSFIVEFWSRVFTLLGKLSIFALISFMFPKAKSSYAFADAWVLGHLLLAFVSVIIVSHLPNGSVISTIIVVYGLLRVFEIAVYQVNVLLFGEYRAIKQGQSYALYGYRRIVLLLLHNYVEIILWLGCTYTVFATDYTHKWEGGASTMLGAIYSSFITMTTFGDFDLMPRSNLAAIILLFHATIGLFMTLLSLARFISLIPTPKTLDPTEQTQIEQSKLPQPIHTDDKLN